MLRRKREELTGDCTKLHSKELCDLYCSSYSSVRTRKTFAGYVVRMGEKKNSLEVVHGEP